MGAPGRQCHSFKCQFASLQPIRRLDSSVFSYRYFLEHLNLLRLISCCLHKRPATCHFYVLDLRVIVAEWQLNRLCGAKRVPFDFCLDGNSSLHPVHWPKPSEIRAEEREKRTRGRQQSSWGRHLTTSHLRSPAPEAGTTNSGAVNRRIDYCRFARWAKTMRRQRPTSLRVTWQPAHFFPGRKHGIVGREIVVDCSAIQLSLRYNISPWTVIPRKVQAGTIVVQDR